MQSPFARHAKQGPTSWLPWWPTSTLQAAGREPALGAGAGEAVGETALGVGTGEAVGEPTLGTGAGGAVGAAAGCPHQVLATHCRQKSFDS